MSIKAGKEDFQWLTSPAADEWIEDAAAEESGNLVALTRRLRKKLGQVRTHLVLELVELRKRARVKFAHADRMYFTRLLLEQATDDRIASYKASRFAAGSALADLCCGIGGDLLAFAQRGPVTGIDRDGTTVELASANCRALGLDNAEVREANAAEVDVDEFDAWHIDPDRRPQGRRTTRLESHQPDLETLQRLRRLNPNGAIKLAPAATVPEDWSESVELEWIGSRRECRQQVAWFGTPARQAGKRAATVIVSDTGEPCTFAGQPEEEVDISFTIKQFLFEPHAAVLAAGLGGSLANRLSLAAIAPEVAYLTHDSLTQSPLLAAFEVIEVLPFDLKRIKKVLRTRGIGRLEVKRRRVQADPATVLKRLVPKGPNSAVLILAPGEDAVRAVLARRVAPKKEEIG